MNKVRCAIYTRKSSEEGLEQAFNSLDAQREACAAYIRSQASEGWVEMPQQYDDGGLSGGSLERPALQRLLDEVAAGRVDIIVVYKVDRLTRSLLDFAKLVEAFDKADVSFVSITQSFNTTSSMGRLTLNMLLSFAQFEREVTAERIRDKIAASKAKGMWMGGVPPLGYEPNGRTLKIVPEQAALVRHIYESYLALGTVNLVSEQLNAAGTRAPVRMTSGRRQIGGKPFSRSQLYYLLKSPIYAGDIPHGTKSYPGQHEAIIARDMWEQVQAKLAEQTQGPRRGRRGSSESPLAGKLVDAAGCKFTISHSCKEQRRYRYYVREGTKIEAAIRIPAAELDVAIARCLADAFDDPLRLISSAGLELKSGALATLTTKAAEQATALRGRDHAALRSVVTRVTVHDDGLRIGCDIAALATMLVVDPPRDVKALLELDCDARIRRTGSVVRLIQASGKSVVRAPAVPVARLLVQARRWWGELRKGELDVTALASRESVTPSYLTRVVRLAFLSPELVEAVLAGDARAEVNGSFLKAAGVIEPEWSAQRARWLTA